MKIKKIAFMTLIIAAALYLNISGLARNAALAYSDDEPIKMKIDMELFEEFLDLMTETFTGAKFEGVVKQTVNGAYMESKYTAYSQNLDYKRIDIIAEGKKVSHVTTPEKVWYYYEQPNFVAYFANKKNVARFNSKVYFDSVIDDGKITKIVSDGMTTYKLVDYRYNIKQTFVFSNSTKKLQLQIVEPESGDKIESTYKGWEKVKIPKDIFTFPARAASKCLDQSMKKPSQSGRYGVGMIRTFNRLNR